ELRPERRVEADPARVEECELVRVADDDERALVRADDVVDGLPERRAGGDLLDRGEERFVATRVVLRGRAREPELAQPLGPTLAPLPRRLCGHRVPPGSPPAAFLSALPGVCHGRACRPGPRRAGGPASRTRRGAARPGSRA